MPPRPRRSRTRLLGCLVVLVLVLAVSGMALTPGGSAGLDAGSVQSTAAQRAWHAEQPTWVQLVNQVRSLARAATASGGPLRRPTRGLVTSGYGARVVPAFDEPVHLGVDFAAPQGRPVVAAAGGIVVTAGHEEAVGNLVVIAHALDDGRPLATVYGHLHETMVTPGQRVHAGEQIGTVGATGTHALGPHLHFEVHVDGEAVDPADWL